MADTKDPALIYHERNELLKYILQNFEKTGGKVLLPIGVAAPESWLLERVDAERLISELDSGARQVELVKLGRNGAHPGHKRGASYVTSGLAEAAATSPMVIASKTNPFGQAPAFGQSPRVAAAPEGPPQDEVDEEEEEASTLLPLPQLQTSLRPSEMKDLSFLVLAASCPPEHQELQWVVCQQLDIARGRAEQMAHTTRTLLSRASRPSTPRQSLFDAANGSPTPSVDVEVMESPYHYRGRSAALEKPATLQLLAVLLQRARRQDFDGFKAFVRWRRTVSHVLVEGLQQASRESWVAPPTSPPAKSLIARLKGALRRLDVTDSEDYDESEYAEAAKQVSAAAEAIAASVRDGWQFPWSMRVRIAELLLRCLFDTLDETSYIEEHDDLLALLRLRVWPLLGVSPLMDGACITWAHFSQFLAHPGDAELLQRLQQHIQHLAGQASGGGGGDRRTSRGAAATEDDALAALVGQKIVEWTAGKLADYHSTFPSGRDMEGCLDLLRFAIHSQGGGVEVVSQKLGHLVVSSINTEFQRRKNALPPSSGAAEVLDNAEVTAGLIADEGNYFSPLLEQHLPGAHALAALRLHAVYSHTLIPFLEQVRVLEDDVLEAIRTSDAVEAQLVDPIEEVRTTGRADAEVQRELQTFMPWGIDTHLQNATTEWVSSQRQLLFTCLQRNVQAESWRPLGDTVGHSGSARDVAGMVVTSVDTLFDFHIPLPPTVVNMLVEVIDNVLCEYAVAVEHGLGPIARLIPPLPPATRFKVQESSRQEQAESGVAPKKGLFSGLSTIHTYPTFLESVPKIDTSLDHLPPRAVACKAASLAFLREEATRLAGTIPQRYQAACNSRSSRRTTKVLDDILEAACLRLTRGIEFCLRFLANKVMLWDGRMDWLERLYRHRVTGCPTTLATLSGPLLNHLEEMGPLLVTYPGSPDITGDEHATLVHDYAAILLAVCTTVIERVLLNGGPTRIFIIEDVGTIKADLQRLKSVFIMDGDGLQRAVVEQVVAPVERVLDLMTIPTGPLLGDLSKARLAGDQVLEGTLIRVAGHRADRNASKYLKNTYSIGKRMK